MHVFRDSASIRGAVDQHPQVAPFIAKRIEELSDYTDYDLGELVHMVVVEPGDTLDGVSQALGFVPGERPADLIDAHPGWCELTYILGDDGFGVVLYVPIRPDIDPAVSALCLGHAASSTGRPAP